MSRIAKNTILIPRGTTVTKNGISLSVKGPLGKLERDFKPIINITIDATGITLKPVKENQLTKALWGTYASHIKNMINGVNQLYEKKLIIEGVGYRAELKGKNLVLSIGFSHQVPVPVPDDVKVVVEKNNMTMTSINKESLGQFAAYIRSLKKPEPYKGKGIRYSDEVVRRKQGKKAA